MNKRNICFSILITVFSLMAVITMFLPYFRIGTTEVKQAFDTTFDGIAQLDSAFEDGGSGDLLPSRSGVKLLKDVIDIPTEQTYNYISGLKRLVVSMLLVAWITAVAVIVIAWVLKKKAKYIVGMTLSAVSIAASLTLYISVPGIAKNALVEAIEKSLFNDTGVYEYLLGSFVKETVLSYIGRICRQLLQHSVQIGFWLLVGMMGAVFIASLVGLILESVRGKVELPSAGDVAQAVSAMIYGIKGEYAGAEAAVGNGIVIGRDPAACQLVLNKDKVSRRHCKIAYNPANNTYVVTDYSSNGTYISGKAMQKNHPTEIPAGTMIQLGKDGDIFRLGK